MLTMLGPVRLRHQDKETILGPPKVNAFLVALLLDTGRIVSTGHLMNLLWDNPPPSACSNLRSFASKLRRELRHTEAQVDGSHGNGFRLTYPQSSVDVIEFRRLTGQARAATRRQAHDQAYLFFKDALALWCGPAGTGARGGGRLDSILCALDQEHSAVTEEMFRARFIVNDVDGLSNDLRKHLGTQPFHDLPWELLIRVEAGHGNISTALSAYQDYCATRAADLGIRPSQRVQALNDALIRNEPLPPLVSVADGPVPSTTG